MTNTTVTKEKKPRTSSKRKTTSSATKTSKTKTAKSENSKSKKIEIELYCDRTELETALTYVKRGIPQNPHHPLLNHVSLIANAEKNTLDLTTNSLEFGANTKIKAKVIRFNIKNLIDVVSTIESDDVCLKILDGQSPCLIEGYGTYESSTIPVRVEHIIAPLLIE